MAQDSDPEQLQVPRPEDRPLLHVVSDDASSDVVVDLHAGDAAGLRMEPRLSRRKTTVEIIVEEIQRRFAAIDIDFCSKFCVLFVVFTVGLPLAAFLVAYHGLATPEKVLAFYLFIVHAEYFVGLYGSLFSHGLIYRIQPRYQEIAHRQIMVLSGVEEFREIACESISEFSNIRGALSNLGLTLVGVVTLTVGVAALLFRVDFWKMSLQQTLAAILSCGSGAGLTTLGVFEMNPEDRRSQLMHYLGFALCLCSFAGLGLETSFCIAFWGLTAIALTATVCWKVVIVSGRRKLPSKDPKFVDKMSKQCIVFESIVLLCGTLAFDLYLYLLTTEWAASQ